MKRDKLQVQAMNDQDNTGATIQSQKLSGCN